MPGPSRPSSMVITPAHGAAAAGSTPDIHVASAATSMDPSSSGSRPDIAMAKICPSCGVHYPAEFNVCPRDATELTELAADSARDELVGQTLSQTYTIV